MATDTTELTMCTQSLEQNDTLKSIEELWPKT